MESIPTPVLELSNSQVEPPEETRRRVLETLSGGEWFSEPGPGSGEQERGSSPQPKTLDEAGFFRYVRSQGPAFQNVPDHIFRLLKWTPAMKGFAKKWQKMVTDWAKESSEEAGKGQEADSQSLDGEPKEGQMDLTRFWLLDEMILSGFFRFVRSQGYGSKTSNATIRKLGNSPKAVALVRKWRKAIFSPKKEEQTGQSENNAIILD